ncbi:MAG: hypothetical protein KAH31_12265 [Candidatus Sabulitectum sp.]|nr:hypothetical protein [Candidatus Sabulitectum sp.]
MTLTVSDTIGVEPGDSICMFGAIEAVIYDANGNITVMNMGVGISGFILPMVTISEPWDTGGIFW